MAKEAVIKWLTVAGVVFASSSVGWAQDFDPGKLQFQSGCAACHGLDGKGKGPVSGQLTVAPVDLTLLAKTNGGVFPYKPIYDVIDGRKAVEAHGTREMPIWGERFNPIVNLPHDVDLSYWKMAGPEQSPEVVVRTRILAVIDYLSRIQQK